jgi:hypothetical protein
VSAHLTTLVNPVETEDCAAIWLEMADGSVCTLALTTGSAREISRHRFCFANLSAESNTAPFRSSHDPWTFTGDAPEVDDRIRETLTAFVPEPEGFAGQFTRYHEALRSGAEFPSRCRTRGRRSSSSRPSTIPRGHGHRWSFPAPDHPLYGVAAVRGPSNAA